MNKPYHFRKSKENLKIIFQKDADLENGCVFSIQWTDLRNFFTKHGFKVEGFRVDENVIDVWHENIMTVQEFFAKKKKMGL